MVWRERSRRFVEIWRLPNSQSCQCRSAGGSDPGLDLMTAYRKSLPERSQLLMSVVTLPTTPTSTDSANKSF
ncbi:hypothetical protein FF1_039806 [Malus domestica]